jgi:hypothetical protein
MALLIPRSLAANFLIVLEEEQIAGEVAAL